MYEKPSVSGMISETYLRLNLGISFNDLTLFILKEYGVFIVVGLILCFPVRKKVSVYLRGKLGENVIGIIEDTALIILTVVSIAFVFKTGSSFFIYQMY